MAQSQAMTAHQDLATALDAAGFWAEHPDRVRLLGYVAAGGSPIAELPDSDRGWWADGEDAAEGDVEEMLLEMAPALAKRGVVLSVLTVDGPHDEGSPGYAIRINGTGVELYRYDPGEPNLPATEDPWLDCTIKPLAEVNRLLTLAGSADRMVVFYPGGNDGLAALLPMAAIDVLATSPAINDADRPVVP